MDYSEKIKGTGHRQARILRITFLYATTASLLWGGLFAINDKQYCELVKLGAQLTALVTAYGFLGLIGFLFDIYTLKKLQKIQREKAPLKNQGSLR